jgi:hypothetical protein
MQNEDVDANRSDNWLWGFCLIQNTTRISPIAGQPKGGYSHKGSKSKETRQQPKGYGKGKTSALTGKGGNNKGGKGKGKPSTKGKPKRTQNSKGGAKAEGKGKW